MYPSRIMPKQTRSQSRQTAQPGAATTQQRSPPRKRGHGNKTGGPNSQDAEPSLFDLVADKQSNDVKSPRNSETKGVEDEDIDISNDGTTLDYRTRNTESVTMDTSVPITPSNETLITTRLN